MLTHKGFTKIKVGHQEHQWSAMFDNKVKDMHSQDIHSLWLYERHNKA